MAGNVFLLYLSLFSFCVNGYVIHIDYDTFFIDETSEYGVHHSLKGGGGIG